MSQVPKGNDTLQTDHYIIFDHRGHVLHVWPEDYTPGPVEIWKIAEGLIGK